MEMKKIIAAVLALWLGLCPAPAYAGIGDAFDLAGAAVSSMFSEDVDQTTNDTGLLCIFSKGFCTTGKSWAGIG